MGNQVTGNKRGANWWRILQMLCVVWNFWNLQSWLWAMLNWQKAWQPPKGERTWEQK